MGFFNEDGDWEDRELETYEEIVTCSHCGKKYRQVSEEQIAGFRDRSEDICPYCHESNGSSMSWDYYNRPIESE